MDEYHPYPLGHQSLDVTLAYLKGKDAESEEAQEHANSSSLALYEQPINNSRKYMPGGRPGHPMISAKNGCH